MHISTPELSKQDLETLLRPQLGRDLVVESFTSQPLTQPGENYGSTMLAIEVKILTVKKKTSIHNLSLVAKLVPPSEFLWKIFDPENTVSKEINCYTLVRDEYENFQNEKRIPEDKFLDVFPKCYGARTTLAEEIGEIADENSVILLENLKPANYRLGDRILGLDLNHVQLAVSQLARFHAISVALKILKPQVFKDTVLTACKPFKYGFSDEEVNDRTLKLVNSAKAIPGCEIYLERIQKAVEWGGEMQKDKTYLRPKEPYATLGHTDFWVNNMMFCYDTNNENIPVSIKFVDFQQVLYTSPVKDLIFFLYTSAAEGIRAKHYDDLIHLYHENFTSCLQDMGCDISSFTFQSLLDEIKEFAPSEVDHILYMLMVICADKKDVAQELSQVNAETIFHEPNDRFKRKAKEFITDFVKRGWL